METRLIIVLPPLLDLGFCIGKGQEPVSVQALLTESTVKALDLRIVIGLPGRLKSSSTPCSYAHLSMTLEMNSLPLSTLIVVGKPRYAAIRFSVLTMSSPLRLCPTSIARFSCVLLSTTVSARKRLPSNNASATKSMLQIWFMAVTSCFGWRNLADLFLLGRFRRSDSPSSWYKQKTQKKKTNQPTHKNIMHSAISVVHTCGCDLLDA